ncbi:MAG: hypothetical protein WBG58_07520, partial [Ignavibacteriaceae bacterium]
FNELPTEIVSLTSYFLKISSSSDEACERLLTALILPLLSKDGNLIISPPATCLNEPISFSP